MKNPDALFPWSQRTECPECGAYHRGRCLDEHLMSDGSGSNGFLPHPEDDPEHIFLEPTPDSKLTP